MDHSLTVSSVLENTELDTIIETQGNSIQISDYLQINDCVFITYAAKDNRLSLRRAIYQEEITSSSDLEKIELLKRVSNMILIPAEEYAPMFMDIPRPYLNLAHSIECLIPRTYKMLPPHHIEVGQIIIRLSTSCSEGYGA